MPSNILKAFKKTKKQNKVKKKEYFPKKIVLSKKDNWIDLIKILWDKKINWIKISINNENFIEALKSVLSSIIPSKKINKQVEKK